MRKWLVMMLVMILKSSMQGRQQLGCDEKRVMHLKGNGETTLVAQADGPNLLTTLCTYLHRGVDEQPGGAGKGNGETMLVAQADGPNLLITLCTYLHRGSVKSPM